MMRLSFSNRSRQSVLFASAMFLAACPKKSEEPAPDQIDQPSAPPAEAEPTWRQQEHMSTHVTITVAAPESPEVLAAIDAAFAEIARLETLLSEWQDGSQITEVNRQAGKQAVTVGEELFAVIQQALEISSRSEGAFDVTVGALWGAWDFRWQDPKIPSDEELATKLPLIGHQMVKVDPEKRTVMLEKEGMQMSLGGIAKGYSVDRASAVLREKGYPDHLVVAGGDLYASGTKFGKKWRIGIRDPRNTKVYATIEVQDEAMATSGNYERYFIRDGKRYHHILNPEDGKPARGFASVTVRAPNATLADGWSTAIFVLGKDKGLEVAKTVDGVEAFVFEEDSYDTNGTPGLMSRMTVLKELAEEPPHAVIAPPQTQHQQDPVEDEAVEIGPDAQEQ